MTILQSIYTKTEIRNGDVSYETDIREQTLKNIANIMLLAALEGNSNTKRVSFLARLLCTAAISSGHAVQQTAASCRAGRVVLYVVLYVHPSTVYTRARDAPATDLQTDVNDDDG